MCVCVSGTLSVSFSVFVCSVLLPSSLNMTLTHTHARTWPSLSVRLTCHARGLYKLSPQNNIRERERERESEGTSEQTGSERKAEEQTRSRSQLVSRELWDSFWLSQTHSSRAVCLRGKHETDNLTADNHQPARNTHLPKPQRDRGEDQMNLWTEFLSVIVICAAGVVMACVGYR